MVDLMGLVDLYLSYDWVAIPLRNKIPVVARWQYITLENSKSIVEKQIELHRCNAIGILCGEASGLTVVDIDVADQGLDLWKSLIKEHEEPATFKVLTPSGGLHYYFKY